MNQQPSSTPPPAHAHDSADVLAMERLLLFTDAVFAIIMTLLALDIRLPEGVHLDSTQAVWDALALMQPKIATYALSFAVVAALWNVHLRRYRLLRGLSGGVIAGNMLQLLLVGLVPFATSLLAERIQPLIVSFYAAIILLNVLVGWGTWLIAVRDPALLRPGLDAATRRAGNRRSIVTASIFAASIAIAWWSARAAMWSWALQIPANALLARLERREAPRGR